MPCCKKYFEGDKNVLTLSPERHHHDVWVRPATFWHIHPEPEHLEELDLRVSQSSTLTPAEETWSCRHDEGCSSSSLVLYETPPLPRSSSSSAGHMTAILLARPQLGSLSVHLSLSLSLYWSGWRTSCQMNDVTWGERSLIITSSCLCTTNTVLKSQTGTQNHLYYVLF